MMVRWMCGVHLKSRMAGVELDSRPGIERIADLVRQSRLCWFGHVEIVIIGFQHVVVLKLKELVDAGVGRLGISV